MSVRCVAGRQNSHDHSGQVPTDLTFPDSKRNPSQLLGRLHGRQVPPSVHGDLLQPQFDIWSPLDRADVCVTVPKASIHPDSKPVARKNKIRIARRSEADVQAEPQTCSVESPAEHKFRPSVCRGPT
jgi:hypothetical protein